ncbi:MAG: biotin synthase BioB [Patescibacteria group bacterium]|nr:biotin synthase BioB [Patescibacteria group bacterium]
MATRHWHELADRVLEGYRLTKEEGLAVLNSPDSELLTLLDAAYQVRRHYFGNRVHLNFLMNARSGLCREDCGYCSQSRTSLAEIPKYSLVAPDALLDGARMAAERHAKTYCTVLSGREPLEEDLEVIASVVPRIKAQWPLKVCLSPGFLTTEQARQLKACGVDRINHNLNTSRRFYPSICTTHDYQQRLETLQAVRAADMEICSGGIVGMGEDPMDVVELALAFGELAVDAQPINFLLPIPGTRMENVRTLNPRYCLKVLALMRLANPPTELRIAAGREEHLGPLQPLGLFPACSIFVGDYLTCKGQPPEDDYRMIEALGFEIAEAR